MLCRCNTVVCCFCVWQGLCFSAAPLSIPCWKQLFSLLHKADCCPDGESCFTWGPLLYCMQILESLVSGDNPVFKTASWVKNGGKHRSCCLFSTACTNRVKLYCTLLHPLKGRIGPITGAIKPFYEVIYWLIWRRCVTCTVWSVQLIALGFPHLSLSLPLCVLTCGSRWEVLQWRSLHHSVRVSHHKHLVEHCVVVDEALDHTRRLDVIQVLFTEDNGHLWTHSKMTHLNFKKKENINESKQLFKPTGTFSRLSKCTGMKTIWPAWQGYWFQLTGKDTQGTALYLAFLFKLELNDNPVTGQVLPFTQSKLWRVWVTSEHWGLLPRGSWFHEPPVFCKLRNTQRRGRTENLARLPNLVQYWKAVMTVFSTGANRHGLFLHFDS